MSTTTTADALGRDAAAFKAAWERILAASESTGEPRQAGRVETIARNYAVDKVDARMVREQAARWASQWTMPAHVKSDMAGWSEAMASLLNGRAGWLVRKYWHAAKDEVFTTARAWPVVSDLHEAALAVSRREGMA